MRATLALVSSLLWAATSAHEEEAPVPNGIIGFGIPLYQDLCGQSCHDSLSALYLNCTTFPDGMDMSSMEGMDMGMDMSMMPETSDECRASNQPWLQTMAYCIQQRCTEDRYPTDQQVESFATWALEGATEPTFADSLPAAAPTEELASDATWLNTTSLVNAELLFTTYGTLREFAREEYFHTRYAVILYLLTIGIIIGCGILANARGLFVGLESSLQTSSVWAKLQTTIFLPALLGGRRLEALPGKIGFVPGRILSIFIAFLIILNVIFSAVSYRTFQPSIYWMSKGFEICEYVGNRTGTLSFVNLSMAILFAGRNNLLISLTGWSQTTFLTLHRWTARIATLQAVVHSIVYTVAYFQPGYNGAADIAAKSKEVFWYWGIIATIAMCLASGFAFLWFRTKYYEIFLITHIALVALALAGCWYHIVPHFGFAYGYQVWLYIAFAFWGFDRLARFARLIRYSRLDTSEAIVEKVPGCDVMHVTVYPWTAGGFGPGQHSFLYFTSLGRFWENHPFSVAAWRRPGESLRRAIISTPSASSARSISSDSKDDNVIAVASKSSASSSSSSTKAHTDLPAESRAITDLRATQESNRASIHFLTRVHSGITKQLHARLLASNSPSISTSIYTEGPYAGHRASLHPLTTADTVLCLVGGIGITNALGFVQAFTESHRSRSELGGSGKGVLGKTKRFILAWSARELSLIEYVQRTFLAEADAFAAGAIEYKFYCTGSDDSIMDAEQVEPEEGEDKAMRKEKRQIEKSSLAEPGRMDVRAIVRGACEPGLQTVVCVCGPGGLSDEVNREVVSAIKEGNRVDIVEEAFAW